MGITEKHYKLRYRVCRHYLAQHLRLMVPANIAIVGYYLYPYGVDAVLRYDTYVTDGNLLIVFYHECVGD